MRSLKPRIPPERISQLCLIIRFKPVIIYRVFIELFRDPKIWNMRSRFWRTSPFRSIRTMTRDTPWSSSAITGFALAKT